MPTNYATKPAANKLQISPNTLRNWSDQYSTFLSESARPGHKPERRFTDKDLTILTYIKQLRSEGLEQPHITERLSETNFYDIELLEPETPELQPATNVDNELQALPAAQEGLQSTHTLLVALDDHNRRLEALERRRLDSITAIGLGFVGGLLFMLVVIVLAWLYGTP